MGFNGIYQVDRAASQPKLLQPMEKGTRFWENLSGDNAEAVFTVDNSETREVFSVHQMRHSHLIMSIILSQR